MRKKTLEEYLLLIHAPNDARCARLLEDHKEKIISSPGSKRKHQAWEGGYVDHLTETMQFATDLYELYAEERGYHFTLSDALLTLLLHDIEKPFKYIGGRLDLINEKAKWRFLQNIVRGYNIELTNQHWNALKYVHGEGNDYHPTKRVQGSLAAFIHICDTLSARVFYDHPRQKSVR